jgi:hypothetical protein
LYFYGFYNNITVEKEALMRKHLVFLKVSSVVVKVAAWIFLFLGSTSGIFLLSGQAPGNPRWTGLIVLAVYIFIFFFFFLVAKMADLLIKIASEKKENL